MGASQCTSLERLSLSNNRIDDDSIGVLAANWLRDEPLSVTLRIASFTRTKTISISTSNGRTTGELVVVTSQSASTLMDALGRLASNGSGHHLIVFAKPTGLLSCSAAQREVWQMKHTLQRAVAKFCNVAAK